MDIGMGSVFQSYLELLLLSDHMLSMLQMIDDPFYYHKYFDLIEDFKIV
jgi:hypothetical protein